jgi:hypothetical protein
MILIKTNHPCLRVGRHSWYQSITGVIHHVWPYFWKPMVRKCLDAHIRTILVLTGGKLIGFYIVPSLYAIYFLVTTHLWQGKKVSILPPGDVNPRPIPSRQGLLEDSPYCAIEDTCLSCEWPQPCTYSVQTLECFVVSSARHEYFVVTYATLSVQR